MTLFTEKTRNILVPQVVLAVLLVSIALVFYASTPAAVDLPVVGWLLFAVIVAGALFLAWLSWENASSKSASKSAVRELSTAAVIMVMFEALTLSVAVLGAFIWLAPAMGLSTALVVPVALGFVSVVVLLLDLLSKTGRLAERWRGVEVGATVIVVFSTVTALFYLALGR
jgi:hypothetical protein